MKRYRACMELFVVLGVLGALGAWVLASDEDYIHVGEDYDEPDYIEVGSDNDLLTETETTPADLWQTTNSTINRIVGGRQIAITEAPYQAVILYQRSLVCGGTVISAVWVLTAAHCINVGSSNSYAVRAGSASFKRGGQYRTASVVATHGRYNDQTSANDIGMVRVNRRFTFSLSLRPARIPTATSSVPNRFLISGWGQISENGANPTVNLRATTIYLVPRALCQQAYTNQNQTIYAHMLCASAPGRDTCQGDSGGPLVNGGIVYGVTSFGIGCARTRYPGVYISVREQLPWIYTVARTFRQAIALRNSMQPKTKHRRLKIF